MDSLPANLRDLQSQLNAAIRAHRNLVGRSNLRPHDGELRLKVQTAERLIVRIYHAQKPLLDQYRHECQAKRAAEARANGQFKSLATVDEVLEDSVRHHFCPSTLEQWAGSVGSISPEKKRKVNFLALFDLITPKLSDDIAESKAPQSRRRQLVNAEFPLPVVAIGGPHPDIGGKRPHRGSGRLPEAPLHPVVASPPPGILTRSSRRARRRLGDDLQQQQQPVATAAAAAAAAAARGEKSPESDSSDARPSDGSSDHRFCCASCHRVLPAAAGVPLASVEWCPECRAMRDSRAGGAIGLPELGPPAECAGDASAGGSASKSSSADSLTAAELENKALMREAEIWQRNLITQEQRRQHLVEQNWRAEKKLDGLLSQWRKVNGM